MPTLLLLVSTTRVLVSIVTSPATSKPVPLISFNSVEVSLAPMLLLPALRRANSIKPSSVVSEASEILPVIFA